jgi:hypothetical protein
VRTSNVPNHASSRGLLVATLGAQSIL